MRRRSIVRKDLIPAGLAFLVLLGGLYAVLLRDARSLQRRESAALVSDRLDAIILGMQSELERDVSLVNSLAAFIGSDPEISQARFAGYARAVMERYPGLVNMAAAPDLIIKYVYPLQGNESALGLDYRSTPDQLVAIDYAIERRAIVFAGPLTLVQGGEAFVIRAPVFLSGGRFWGMASIPVLTESLYARARLDRLEDDRTIAIRGRDGLGMSGEVFFGNPAVFASEGAIRKTIPVGDGSWEIAGAIPSGGSLSARMVSIDVIAAACLLAGLLVFFLLNRERGKDEVHREALLRNERFLKQVEDVSKVGGWRLDRQGRFSELTTWARRLWGLPDGAGLPDIDGWEPPFNADGNARLKDLLLYALRHRQPVDTSLELAKPDGAAVWLRMQAEPGIGAEADELIGAVQDVTDEEVSRRRIEYQTNYDQLTRLPNRRLLADRLGSALSRARRSKELVAVAFIEIADFKTINDNLGHRIGDLLLTGFGQRLRDRLRSTDTVARYGGDEFVVVLSDLGSAQDAAHSLGELQTMVSQPYSILGKPIHASANIGVSLFPDDAADPESLILKAHQAMHVAKTAGDHGLVFFEIHMHAAVDQRNQLYQDLAAVVEADGLEVHFQPIMHAATGRVAGCESLVRWQRADGSWVRPDLLVSIAEERGLVSRIDLQVLEKAVSRLRAFNQTYRAGLYLSVNASPRLLCIEDDIHRRWVQRVGECIDFPLSIEITERVLMDMGGRGLSLLKELYELGKGLALDDFGTGYSGFTYLSRFPLTTIKIDQSFVHNMFSSEKDRALVESIVGLSKKLGLNIVAEGVETAEEARLLTSLGCDYLQGFYFAKPMPLAAFADFVVAANRLVRAN